MELIDLSRELFHRTQTHPSHPPVIVTVWGDHSEKKTAGNTTFTVGSTGTFEVATSGFPAAALTASGTLPSGVTFTDNSDGTATLSGTPAANSGGLDRR